MEIVTKLNELIYPDLKITKGYRIYDGDIDPRDILWLTEITSGPPYKIPCLNITLRKSPLNDKQQITDFFYVAYKNLSPLIRTLSNAELVDLRVEFDRILKGFGVYEIILNDGYEVFKANVRVKSNYNYPLTFFKSKEDAWYRFNPYFEGVIILIHKLEKVRLESLKRQSIDNLDDGENCNWRNHIKNREHNINLLNNGLVKTGYLENETVAGHLYDMLGNNEPPVKIFWNGTQSTLYHFIDALAHNKSFRPFYAQTNKKGHIKYFENIFSFKGTDKVRDLSDPKIDLSRSKNSINDDLMSQIRNLATDIL